jgi:hypothetical protein
MMIDSMMMLERETSLRPGDTPQSLPGALAETPTYSITQDAFLLKLPSGLSFYYERGKGVAVSRPDSVTDGEVALFFNGSVYGAIAWLNGLVPLHASGVVHNGQVHAFTGASGAGKSTLAAALGSRGFALLADDVLVLDLSDPETILCLPGHKQIKLWSDAFNLTAAERCGQVRPDLDKYFVAPPGGVHDGPLPLAHLSFIEDHAKQANFKSIKGVARFTYAGAAFYRPGFCNAIAENRNLFATVARISQHVPISILERARGEDVFATVADYVAASIRNEYG